MYAVIMVAFNFISINIKYQRSLLLIFDVSRIYLSTSIDYHHLPTNYNIMLVHNNKIPKK